MKLNVGCGEFYADGWFNIDVTKNEQVSPDFVGTIDDLDGMYEAVYCGHVLEHIPYDRVHANLIAIREHMQLGAHIMCVGPDVDRAAEMFAVGTIGEETYRTCLADAGAQRWDGDYHHWNCREAELLALLEAAGFTDVHPVAVDSQYLLTEWPLVSGIGWQCAAEGTR